MGEVVTFTPNPGSPAAMLPYVERQLENLLAWARQMAPQKVDEYEIKLRVFRLEKAQFLRDADLRRRWLLESEIVITG